MVERPVLAVVRRPRLGPPASEPNPLSRLRCAFPPPPTDLLKPVAPICVSMLYAVFAQTCSNTCIDGMADVDRTPRGTS